MPKMSTQHSANPATTAESTVPWHAAYPAPKNTEPLTISREEVLALLKAQHSDKKGSDAPDSLLVDVRRVDHAVRDSFRFALSGLLMLAGVG